MYVVIFEVTFRSEEARKAFYREGDKLAERLKGNEDFLGSANYPCADDPDTDLCMNYWKTKDALDAWRNDEQHRIRQVLGRKELFAKYTITVCEALYRYTKDDRDQAPEDSNRFHLS